MATDVVTATATATATGGGASAVATASAGAGRRGGFSVRGLLGNVISSVASATVRQYAGQSNAAALCIRQVIQVL